MIFTLCSNFPEKKKQIKQASYEENNSRYILRGKGGKNYLIFFAICVCVCVCIMASSSFYVRIFIAGGIRGSIFNVTTVGYEGDINTPKKYIGGREVTVTTRCRAVCKQCRASVS